MARRAISGVALLGSEARNGSMKGFLSVLPTGFEPAPPA
jgi:hypothetical protein